MISLSFFKPLVVALILGGSILFPKSNTDRQGAQEGKKTVFVIRISGIIDLGLAPYVERVIADANDSGADAILVHIDTFGGRVDAAVQIKDALLDSKILTIAFIDKQAISAGSFIALSCRKIVMAPGSSFGASTVVDQEGQKQSEKAQSVMRSEFRAVAEANGRDPGIAESMVDENIEVEGVVKKGELLTLTPQEALKIQFADATAGTIEEVLALYGLQNSEMIESGENWAENVARFLTNPYISTILMSLGFMGLFYEVISAGWGVSGTAGLICLGLFFFGHYIVNLADWLELMMFAIGIILILIEIFYIPGFGFAGISGGILVAAALVMSLLGSFKYVTIGDVSDALMSLMAAALITVFVIIATFKYIPKTGVWNKLVLQEQETQELGFSSSSSTPDWIGMNGTALTSLRPGGTALLAGKRMDVVTEGDFIDKGEPVRVVATKGVSLVVQRIETPPDGSVTDESSQNA